MTKSDTLLPLRYAGAELLLQALKRLPDDQKKTVLYLNLSKKLTAISNAWNAAEKERKKTQQAVLQSKAFNAGKRRKTR